MRLALGPDITRLKAATPSLNDSGGHMLSRIIGIVIALVSLFFYIWHLAKQGGEPHSLQALLAGGAIVFGLWLALPGRQRQRQ